MRVHTKNKLSLSGEEVKKVASSFKNNQIKKTILNILKMDSFIALVCEKIQTREDYIACFGRGGYFENNKEMENATKKYLMEHPKQLYRTIEKMSRENDVRYTTTDPSEMPIDIDRNDVYYDLVGSGALKKFTFIGNEQKGGESLAKYIARYEKEIREINLKDIKIVETTVNKLLEPMKNDVSIWLRKKTIEKREGAFLKIQEEDNQYNIGLN